MLFDSLKFEKIVVIWIIFFVYWKSCNLFLKLFDLGLKFLIFDDKFAIILLWVALDSWAWIIVGIGCFWLMRTVSIGFVSLFFEPFAPSCHLLAHVIVWLYQTHLFFDRHLQRLFQLLYLCF